MTIALAAGALFTSCDNARETDVAGGKEIRFSATIGQYQVKATDTAFEEGDAIGLFAADPVSAENVLLTWADGELTPEHPVYWGEYQMNDEAVPFFAYYPFVEDQGVEFNFTVPADQTTEAAFKSADLMLASTLASPKDESVVLHFAHRMARLIVVPTNRLDAQIESITLSGLALEAEVDISIPSVYLSEDAKPEVIIAAPVADDNDRKGWAAIFPAQKASTFAITAHMDNGKEYTVEAENALFREGHSYQANIVFDEAMSALEFTADVADWIDDWYWIGKAYDPGKLNVTWNISVDGRSRSMEQLEDGRWHFIYPEFEGYADIQLIKCNNYYNGVIPEFQYFGANVPWDVVFTIPTDKALDVALAPDRHITVQGEGSVLEFWLDADARRLTIAQASFNWEFLGTGKMVETLIAGYFELPKQELDIDIYYDPNIPNVYRIARPYKNWVCPEGFTYGQGEDLLIYLEDVVGARFGVTRTGVKYGNEDIVIQSWNGYLDQEYGYIYFWSGEIGVGDKWQEIYDYRYYMYIVLPGGSRPVDNEIEVNFEGAEDDETEDAVPIKSAYMSVYAGMDIEEVRGGLFVGKLSSIEVSQAAKGLVSNGDMIYVEPQSWEYFSVPVYQTGTYTYIVVAKASDGSWNYRYVSFSVLFGEEAPEAVMTLSAVPGFFEEGQIIAHVDFENPDVVYGALIEESAWQEAQLSDDDVYDYVMSNGSSINPNYMGTAGADIFFVELKPETTYRVMFAGRSVFDKSAWGQVVVTTGTEPEFTGIGTGHYFDGFDNVFGEDGWYTEVEIQKAETSPVRYRALAPYDGFWAKHNSVSYYSGKYAKWIDFCIVGDQIHYLPYLIGYEVEGYGPVQYSCYNSLSGYFFMNNSMIKEGVYNIAPGAYILGTRYWYNLTTYWEGIYLEMPGYSLEETEQAGAPAIRLSKMDGQALTPHDKVLPFTRHMLHTGDVKVNVREK